MKILVIGSGGREHALVWKLRQSPRVSAVYCAPGNAGTAEIATNVPLPISDHHGLIEFARAERIGLIVVGPDDALAAGIVDHLGHAGLRVFGPTQSAARLESSKVFAKEFMQRHGIPTAASGHFSDPAEAHRFCQKSKFPLVIKADGLALGKGVIIAQTPWEAAQAINEIMEKRAFGAAGDQVVIEEFLSGQECSVHALVDGENYVLFPAAQDHKQIFEGDKGPNTGGMGTFSPPDKLVTPEIIERIHKEIMVPFMEGIKKDGLHYKGLLFPGLMITEEGPKVLEFNCRFGDPETQVLLPRLKGDLVDWIEAAVAGRLDLVEADWDPRPACCVVMASGGYPGSYTKGKVITGIEEAEALGDVTVFHAGTHQEEGALVTAGGRVLGVTAMGGTLAEAQARAYEAVSRIHFEGATFRRDIGAKGL